MEILQIAVLAVLVCMVWGILLWIIYDNTIGKAIRLEKSIVENKAEANDPDPWGEWRNK